MLAVDPDAPPAPPLAPAATPGPTQRPAATGAARQQDVIRTPEQQTHVFVSYSRSDRSYVDRLVAYLNEAGVETWIDEASIDYGSHWLAEIRNAIDECRSFVVVMTPAAEDSEWVQNEVHHALQEYKAILPLLLKGTPLFQVGTRQYEDVRTGEMPSQAFLDRLRQAL